MNSELQISQIHFLGDLSTCSDFICLSKFLVLFFPVKVFPHISQSEWPIIRKGDINSHKYTLLHGLYIDGTTVNFYSFCGKWKLGTQITNIERVIVTLYGLKSPPHVGMSNIAVPSIY